MIKSAQLTDRFEIYLEVKEKIEQELLEEAAKKIKWYPRYWLSRDPNKMIIPETVRMEDGLIKFSWKHKDGTPIS